MVKIWRPEKRSFSIVYNDISSEIIYTIVNISIVRINAIFNILEYEKLQR